MRSAEDMEAILARLMPAALSEPGAQRMEETIDELALESGCPVEVPAKPVTVVRWPWLAGAAAAVAAVVTMLLGTQGSRTSPAADAPPVAAEGPSLVRISQSESLESVVEEGWRDDGQGKAHQTLRLQVVKREQLLDGETGILMTVSEPREEVLLVPVNAF